MAPPEGLRKSIRPVELAEGAEEDVIVGLIADGQTDEGALFKALLAGQILDEDPFLPQQLLGQAA